MRKKYIGGERSKEAKVIRHGNLFICHMVHLHNRTELVLFYYCFFLICTVFTLVLKVFKNQLILFKAQQIFDVFFLITGTATISTE